MSRQFLSFVLDGALYAVEVAQVQEVLEYTQPVRLPCTIDYVEGLISSREQGISVVNLRKKFELKTVEPTKKTRIIIIEIAHTENDVTSVVTFGAIADSVEEVIDLEEDTIEPAPKFGNNISGEYIRGIGKKDNKFIIILDIDKVFSTEESCRSKIIKAPGIPGFSIFRLVVFEKLYVYLYTKTVHKLHFIAIFYLKVLDFIG